MCERCATLVRDLQNGTGLSEADVMYGLWNHTAYPFNSAEETAAQLREWVADITDASREEHRGD